MWKKHRNTSDDVCKRHHLNAIEHPEMGKGNCMLSTVAMKSSIRKPTAMNSPNMGKCVHRF
ncbi:MAG TPA: hypothetical protein P5092_10045 [Ruminococcus sp.]|nr:hypothetical protein [Ruminococcus sp.]